LIGQRVALRQFHERVFDFVYEFVWRKGSGRSILVDGFHGPLSLIVPSGRLDHVRRRNVGIENNIQYESEFRTHLSYSSLVTPESPFCQTSFTNLAEWAELSWITPLNFAFQKASRSAGNGIGRRCVCCRPKTELSVSQLALRRTELTV